MASAEPVEELVDVDAILLCASGCAYYIDPITGKYPPHSDPYHFKEQARWLSPPIAYAAPATAEAQSSGTAHQEEPPLKINACLVGQTAAGIVIAFRGTLFDEAGEVDDWIQDLRFEPMKNPSIPGKVHTGFNEAVEALFNLKATSTPSSLLQAVQDLVSSNPAGTPVYVTGHSKGGGMAPIAACLLLNNGITPAKIVTFAAPKPGNSEFQTYYNDTFPNHVRYENYGDLVPFFCPPPYFAFALSLLLQYELPRLAEALLDVAQWDYQPVGKAESYIGALPECKVDTTTDMFDITLTQTANLMSYIYENTGGLEDAFKRAHTIDCGGGYRTAVCPAGCPPQAPV